MLVSVPRDVPPRSEPGRPSGATGSRPRSEVREATAALPLPADWDASVVGPASAEDDEAGLPPLSAAAMGTRDRPPTRVESPAARRPPSGAPSPRPAPPAQPAPERAEDRLGTTLGAYRLHALLGKGGMGFVYRAEHARLGREVALKLLRADYARRRDSVARFFQEARTVNRIRHRNIVDVTDFVELDDGTTFIIMELLRGQSLGSWARHAFDLPRALGLLIQICDGLAAAHAVGVIHRDLKPDNVVVMPTGDGAETVKLLDFGVAKLLNRDDEDVGLETAAGSVIGTPAYMSPEQAGGMAVDARADIYSLGAIMYELFCGQPLFRGRSFGEYVRKHLTEAPFPPRQTPRGATLDPRLEHILLRCLEKDPDRRFQTVEDLRHQLLELLGDFETLDGPPAAARAHRSARREPVTDDPMPPRRSGMETIPGVGRTTGGRAAVPPPTMATARARDRAHSPARPELVQAGPPTPHPGGPPTPYPGAASYPGATSSLGGSLIGLDPRLAPRPRRGIWVAAGVAIVTGIGVAAAMIAGARDRETPTGPTTAEPTAPARATRPVVPQVTAGDPGDGAAVPPPPTAMPTALIEVRIDAPPGARVLRAGAEVEVCVAPCRLAIDPADGDSPTRRDYVVRLDGFRDQVIAIDLAAPPPLIAVRFAADQAVAPGSERADEPAAGGERPEPGRKRSPGKAGTATTAATVDSTPTAATHPSGAPLAGDTPDAVTPPTTPPAKKRGSTVDPTDTIDPFAPR